MSDFTIDYDKLSLDGIYTDISDTSAKETTVYANGNMQARIYISYSYNDYDVDDTDSEVTNTLDQYIKDHIIFYWLDSSNNLNQLTGWNASAQDNGYQHNIDYAEPGSKTTSGISGRHVPYYLIPPAGDYGVETRLCAKLVDTSNGVDEQTSVDSPVKVHTQQFHLQSDDLRIRDVESINDGSTVLRSLHYASNGPSSVPESHKPIKLENYRGIKPNSSVSVDETKTEIKTNSWIAMMHSNKGHKAGIFPEYQVGKIAVLQEWETFSYDYAGEESGESGDISSTYDMMGTGWKSGDSWLWSETIKFDTLDVTDGIPMVKITSVDLIFPNFMAMPVDFETQDFTLIDNYGNRVSFDINWDYGGDWYHNWQPSNVEVKQP